MPDTAGQTIYQALVELVTLLLVVYALLLLLRTLRRNRPDLAIGPAVALAVALRVLSAAAVSLTTIAGTLRGSDEAAFVGFSHQISETPFGSPDWTNALTHELQNFVFSLQVWIFDSPDFALRIGQVGIAVAGLILLATCVYELAGPRAAIISAWLLALEPSSVFFSTLLHKEANMMLAIGLVAFGGTMIWKRGDLRYLSIIALGCLVAVATRFYAGWFLIAAGGAICLHAALRPQYRGSARSLSLVALFVIMVAVAAPTVLGATTQGTLTDLQVSQNANATDESNLGLEQVDFSTRGAIVSNLPGRIYDVLFRPYPWQLANPSQQLGLLGTTVAYVTLLLLVLGIYRNRGQVMERAGPLIYTCGFLLIAYALSTGNAGTAFRYRTGLVAVAISLVSALWFARKSEAPEPAQLAPERRPRLAPHPSVQ